MITYDKVLMITYDEVMITSPIEMLVTKLWSHDHIYNIISVP